MFLVERGNIIITLFCYLYFMEIKDFTSSVYDVKNDKFYEIISYREAVEMLQVNAQQMRQLMFGTIKKKAPLKFVRFSFYAKNPTNKYVIIKDKSFDKVAKKIGVMYTKKGEARAKELTFLSQLGSYEV